MKTRRRLLGISIAAAIAYGCGAPALAAESHQHAASEPTKLSLDHGKKWATDEPLRRNMNEIRAALAAKQVAIHAAALKSEDYRALGALVEARVASIVAECKLPPAADANLHLVVADLIGGADAMQGKSETAPAAGVKRVVRAVNDYGRYFNHPGWKPLQ